MSFLSSGVSAIGKLAAVGLLAGAFLFGLAGVVYMSLQGTEVKVPDITGKDFVDSERELASLGLKLKKRADRPSTEKPNTVIEQLPKPGETVKTGQMILVVTSKRAEGDETPQTNKKTTDEDDTEKIEEMITDKPKKPKANTNSNHKKADTTRDVNASTSNSNSNSNSTDTNSNKKENGTSNNSGDKTNKNTQTPPNRVPAANKPGLTISRPKPQPKQP